MLEYQTTKLFKNASTFLNEGFTKGDDFRITIDEKYDMMPCMRILFGSMPVSLAVNSISLLSFEFSSLITTRGSRSVRLGSEAWAVGIDGASYLVNI